MEGAELGKDAAAAAAVAQAPDPAPQASGFLDAVRLADIICSRGRVFMIKK